MKGTLSDKAKEQIVRTCRATLGDELRHVRYVTRNHRECLYERKDVSLDIDTERPIRFSNRDPDFDFDAYCVVIFANKQGCRVFIGESDVLLCRCNSNSVTNFGEMEVAITAILNADRP